MGGMTFRLAALVATTALATVAAAGCGGSETAAPATTQAATAGSSLPVVSCNASIGGARYSGTENGNRVVLDGVSVPPDPPEGASPSGTKGWPYFAEVGVILRVDQPPVDVSVPKASRTGAAISWDQSKPVPAVRFETCPSLGLAWNAYAGGIYLKERTACVPLTFQVGERSETLRIGIGERCKPA